MRSVNSAQDRFANCGSKRRHPTVSAMLAWLLCVSVSVLAVDARAAASVGPQLTAARTSNPATPADVPDGYVVTPNGYFHPSCVRHIESDQHVLADGSIKNADQSISAARTCAYPRFRANGQRIDPQRSSSPAVDGDGAPADYIHGDTLFTGTFDIYDGYIESTTSLLAVAQSVKRMSASFTVPVAPVRKSGQTIYLFPGLEHYEDVQTILQPVLGFDAFTDNAWTLTSWNCCQDGMTNYAGPIAIAAGNTVEGSMTGASCNASTHVCANWSVDALNTANNQHITLQTSAYGQPFDWLFGGALEVYGVTRCDELPATRSVNFAAIDATTAAGAALVNLSWSYGNPGALVACDYHIDINPADGHAGNVTLHY